MKKLIFIITLSLIGCATPKKEIINYEGALPELYRAGTPSIEPYPNYTHRISHTCTSSPIYDLYGYYVRTDVRCW